MKTKKHAIFYSLMFIWLCINFALYIYSGIKYLIISDHIFCIIFMILVVLKHSINKFNNWLESPL